MRLRFYFSEKGLMFNFLGQVKMEREEHQGRKATRAWARTQRKYKCFTGNNAGWAVACRSKSAVSIVQNQVYSICAKVFNYFEILMLRTYSFSESYENQNFWEISISLPSVTVFDINDTENIQCKSAVFW